MNSETNYINDLYDRIDLLDSQIEIINRDYSRLNRYNRYNNFYTDSYSTRYENPLFLYPRNFGSDRLNTTNTLNPISNRLRREYLYPYNILSDNGIDNISSERARNYDRVRSRINSRVNDYIARARTNNDTVGASTRARTNNDTVGAGASARTNNDTVGAGASARTNNDTVGAGASARTNNDTVGADATTNTSFNENFATNFAQRVHNILSNINNNETIPIHIETHSQIIVSHKSISNNTKIELFNEEENSSEESNIDENNDIPRNRCVICIENIDNNSIVRRLNKCNHYFHINCIDKWFETKITCPTCRQDIRELPNVNIDETNNSMNDF